MKANNGILHVFAWVIWDAEEKISDIIEKTRKPQLIFLVGGKKKKWDCYANGEKISVNDTALNVD